MAGVTSRSRPIRNTGSAKRARALAEDAIKQANELTMRVLEGGRSPRRAKRAKGRKASPETRAEALVAPIGLRADVTPQLIKAAPAFGDVLRSIAHAVSVTQTALDDAALESLETLAGQQVQVPVLVEQTLDDDGVPTTVTIRTESVPLTSIITPSMQQVEQLTLRMDMRVQSFDATSGIKFNQNMSSAGVSYQGHKFGFGVATNNTNINSQFSNLSDFSEGSVVVSMDIVDRTGFQIPTPLQYGIGSNLSVRLLGVTQTLSTIPGPPPVTTVTRVAELSVKQVKLDGSVVDLGLGEYDVTIPPGLLFVQGTTLEVTRNPATATDAYEERKIYVTVGQLIKEATFYI
jgi:hypothetical protein